MTNLLFKWTVSRGINTCGYNICSLYENEKKIISFYGGGYDMEGACLGEYISKKFAKQLIEKLKKDGKPFLGYNTVFCGLNITEEIKVDKKTGKWYKTHEVLTDGACGFTKMENILEYLGYKLDRIPQEKKDNSMYTLNRIKK
jgi:hypothetical protein